MSTDPQTDRHLHGAVKNVFPSDETRNVVLSECWQSSSHYCHGEFGHGCDIKLQIALRLPA